MKRVLLSVAALLVLFGGVAGAQSGPAGFEFVIGPRLGVSGVLAYPDDFTESVQEVFPDGTYFPVMTVFGINFEQRVLLGQTDSHFVFQEIVLVSGLEQSIALPTASILIGFRDYSGFEIGAGPTISFSGLGVVVAVGWTFSTNGVFIPVDVSCVLPSAQSPTRLALTTGFNFVARRR